MDAIGLDTSQPDWILENHKEAEHAIIGPFQTGRGIYAESIIITNRLPVGKKIDVDAAGPNPDKTSFSQYWIRYSSGPDPRRLYSHLVTFMTRNRIVLSESQFRADRSLSRLFDSALAGTSDGRWFPSR